MQASDVLPQTSSDLLAKSLQKHTEAHVLGRPDHPPPSSDTQRIHSIYTFLDDDERSDGLFYRITGLLERLTRPRIHFGSRDFSSYHVFGALGMVLAAVIALGLTSARGLSAGSEKKVLMKSPSPK